VSSSPWSAACSRHERHRANPPHDEAPERDSPNAVRAVPQNQRPGRMIGTTRARKLHNLRSQTLTTPPTSHTERPFLAGTGVTVVQPEIAATARRPWRHAPFALTG